MRVQIVRPEELRLTATGPGVPGQEGVIYQTPRNGSTMSRAYIWNGERHVQFGQPEVEALVSGAWNLATSGAWRPAALGALPRFSVSGGASGGTWALSYRNAAGTVTSDAAETVAAGAVDVSPVFLDDATEIMVTVTGTVTVEVK